MGPGSVLNVSGMLGLHELAEPFKPKADAGNFWVVWGLGLVWS